MSKQDKVQLWVIYMAAFVAIIVAFLVWSGVFGSPKYQKEAQTQPNWLTDYNYNPPKLVGSTKQSDSFDGNFASQPGGLNVRNDLRLVDYGYYGPTGVRPDSGNTTGIPSY